MLSLYIASLVLGGGLVAVSLVGGALDAQADVDADVDMDADMHGDVDADADGDSTALVDIASAWLPIGSLRFWTFLLAFGGLTGALLTWLTALPTLPVAGISLGLGYATGLAFVRAVRWLPAHDAGGGVRHADFIGASGTVLLPVTSQHAGQVRIEVGGKLVDHTARSMDEHLDIDAPVLVCEVAQDGALLVTRAPDALPAPTTPNLLLERNET